VLSALGGAVLIAPARSARVRGTCLLLAGLLLLPALGVAALPSMPGKLTATSGGRDETFGAAVAVDGEWMAVGAPNAKVGSHATGAVDLFRRLGGNWLFFARLNPVLYFSGFGESVALTGTTLAVGAPDRDEVRVYRWDGVSWNPQATLVTPAPAAGGIFGHSVAASGDTIAVGVWLASPVHTQSGAVDVFRRVAGNWTHEARLLGSDTAAHHGLGWSVDLDPGGDRLVAGAPWAPGTGAALFGATGAAYVFDRTPAGWAQAAKLVPPGTTSLQFGRSVGVDGPLVAVGSYWDSKGANNAGAAYTFLLVAGAWTQEAMLQAPDVQAWHAFGWSLTLSGSHLVVGAMHDDMVDANSGAAYLFERTPLGWSCGAKLKAHDLEAGAQYGVAVAMDADTLVVGALTDDWNGARNGAAYVYGLAALPTLAVPGLSCQPLPL
jgi:hypothetical protein